MHVCMMCHQNTQQKSHQNNLLITESLHLFVCSYYSVRREIMIAIYVLCSFFTALQSRMYIKYLIHWLLAFVYTLVLLITFLLRLLFKKNLFIVSYAVFLISISRFTRSFSMSHDQIQKKLYNIETETETASAPDLFMVQWNQIF